MNEQLCWQLIDASWAVFPPLNQTRKRAIALNNVTALEQLGLMLDRLIVPELQKQLKKLSKEELVGFIQFFEQQLTYLSNHSPSGWNLHRQSDIHLAIAFAIGMGSHYFQQIKRQPTQLHIRLQSISFAMLPYATFEQVHGVLPAAFQRPIATFTSTPTNRPSSRNA